MDLNGLPGKPLLEIDGKPLIQWVYERALKVKELDRIVVATDDDRIQDSARAFWSGSGDHLFGPSIWNGPNGRGCRPVWRVFVLAKYSGR